MGKVLSVFGNGSPGAVTRAVDNVIISLKNAGTEEIPFGTPVFISGDRSGAVPFSTASPQDFSDFLGFAVRVADKTPETYPGGPFDEQPQGVWKPGDVMEILVRGSLAVKMTGTARRAGHAYIRKSDGVFTANSGSEGTTLDLQNVRIRNTRTETYGCVEIVVLNRNLQ